MLTYHQLKLKEKKDGYYISVPCQGSKTKLFWNFAGKTLEEAESLLKTRRESLLAPKKFLTLPAKDKKRIWRKINVFRKIDVEKFNSKYKVAFYSDSPFRFSGKNKNNPTTELFDSCGFAYDFIGTEQILNGELREYKIVFTPGGFGYFPNKKLKEKLTAFVKNGGGFTGFCAGAFLPLKNSLGICDSEFAYFRQQGITEVLLDPNDPVAKGITKTKDEGVYALFKKGREKSKYTVCIRMYRSNGPLFVPKGKDKVVGYFDSTENYAAILRSQHGKGRIVVFSGHPDTNMVTILNLASEADLIENTKLFKNALLYCAGF